MFVLHGGAGTVARQSMTPELEQQYRESLAEGLQTGHAVLAKGGPALDAVEAGIRVLEDSPLFNAGKGSVFNHEGRNEMDASSAREHTPTIWSPCRARGSANTSCATLRRTTSQRWFVTAVCR